MGGVSRLVLVAALVTSSAQANPWDACRALLARLTRTKHESPTPMMLRQQSAEELRRLREEALGWDDEKPLPPELRTKLFEEMHRYLDLDGQPTELRYVEGRAGLRLVPVSEPANRFQRTVKVLKERFGVDVVYEPTLMRSGRGVFLPGSNEIAVSPVAVLEGGFGTVVHEAAHAVTFSNLRERKASPFHGFVTGAVPYLFSDWKNYKQDLAFDEMRAYWVQLHHLRAEAKKSSGPAREASLFLAEKTAEAGLEISRAVQAIARDAQRSLREGAAPAWENDPMTKVLHAVWSMDGANGAPVKVYVPLVANEGAEDTNRLERLLRQLNDTEKAAEKILKGFRELLKTPVEP